MLVIAFLRVLRVLGVLGVSQSPQSFSEFLRVFGVPQSFPESSEFSEFLRVFRLLTTYKHDCTPKVVAMAVSTVMTICRICFQKGDLFSIDIKVIRL